MRLAILILSLLPSAWAFECPRGHYDLDNGKEVDFMETCTQEMFCKEYLYYPSSSVWFWGCDEDGMCTKEGCNETLCCSYTGHVAPITKLSTTTTVATTPTTTLPTLSTTTTVYKVTSCPTGVGEERVECDEPTYCYARWVDGIMRKGCAESGECPNFGIHGDTYCSYSGTLTLDPPSDMITEATTTTTVETESDPPITSTTPSATTTIPETTESATPSFTTTTEATTTARPFECPSGNYEMSTGKMPKAMQTCKRARFCVEHLFSDGTVWNGCDENMRCLKHGCKGRLCCSKTGNIARTAPWFRHPTTTTQSTTTTEATTTTTMSPETEPTTQTTTTTTEEVHTCPSGIGENVENLECPSFTYCYARLTDGQLLRGCTINGECTEWGCNDEICCTYTGWIPSPSNSIDHPFASSKAITTTNKMSDTTTTATTPVPTTTTTKAPETEPSTTSTTTEVYTTTEIADSESSTPSTAQSDA